MAPNAPNSRDARRPSIGVSVCLKQGDAILLIERGRPPFRGLLSLPGGSVEFGETLRTAVAREVLEETGIVLAEASSSLHFVTMHEAFGTDFHVAIAVHAALLDGAAQPVAGDDAARLLFMTRAKIEEAQAQGRTTPDLCAVVDQALAVLDDGM